MHIGQRIKTRRIQLGLSVDDVSKIIGKNRATVYRYESHEIEKFDIAVLEPLAIALKTTPAYLMGWTEEINNSFNNNKNSFNSTVNHEGNALSLDERELLEMYRGLSLVEKTQVISLIIELSEKGGQK